jgi:hypothetical protein
MGSKARANTGSSVATGPLGMGSQPVQFNSRVNLPSTGVRISADGTASHFAINPKTGRLQKFDPSKFANGKTKVVDNFYDNLQKEIDKGRN